MCVFEVGCGFEPGVAEIDAFIEMGVLKISTAAKPGFFKTGSLLEVRVFKVRVAQEFRSIKIGSGPESGVFEQRQIAKGVPPEYGLLAYLRVFKSGLVFKGAVFKRDGFIKVGVE